MFKKRSSSKVISSAALSLCLVGSLVAPSFASAAEDKDVVQLRLLETTDIHTNLVNYDYYQDISTNEFGLIKTASLVKEAREEATNTMLFDNGDLIQGSPLGDYFATVDPIKNGEIHPVYKVMNEMQYDVGNIGNHEFNYGLDFLSATLAGSNFPYVNANVYKADGDNDETNDVNYFTPYEIIDKTVLDEDGDEHIIKVGVIGFVPPQIMNWDKDHLTGKIIAKDIIETANKFVPEMKEKGADLIVAIAHSGIGSLTQGTMAENATSQLTTVEGIDTVLFGHSHGTFPSEDYKDIPGVDLTKGTLNGIPAVMPGSWGSHLGIVDFTLELVDGKWTITNGTSSLKGIQDSEGNLTVEADPHLMDVIQHDHETTLEYIRGPVGETTAPINSFFAQVLDDPSIQIVSDAQKWYVEKYIQGTEYDGIPVLSAAAPFKAGTRNNPTYYTDIPAGTIAIKNVSDLYLYPNTLRAVLLNGEQLREWLEMSAGQFNTIDPTKTEEQALVNMNFRSYNYDVIDGVNYQIDVTQEQRYSADGELINPDSHRIVNLSYNGEEVGAQQQFLVATNNYRAGGGGGFPGLGTEIEVVVNSPDENRQVIIDYIREKGRIDPSADNNWSFAPINENVNITFESTENAKAFSETIDHIEYVDLVASGFAKYRIDLSSTEENEGPVINPEDPVSPETPENNETPKPEAPEDSNTTQEEASNDEKATDAKPSTVEEKATTATENQASGKELPNTATNQFKWIAFGLALLAAGGALLFIIRKKKESI